MCSRWWHDQRNLVLCVELFNYFHFAKKYISASSIEFRKKQGSGNDVVQEKNDEKNCLFQLCAEWTHGENHWVCWQNTHVTWFELQFFFAHVQSISRDHKWREGCQGHRKCQQIQIKKVFSLLFTHGNSFKVCCYRLKCNFNRTHNQHTAHENYSLANKRKCFLRNAHFLRRIPHSENECELYIGKEHCVTPPRLRSKSMETLMRAWCGQMAQIAPHTHAMPTQTNALKNGSPKHWYRPRYDNTP